MNKNVKVEAAPEEEIDLDKKTVYIAKADYRAPRHCVLDFEGYCAARTYNVK